MKNFLNNNFLSLAILAMLVIIYLQRTAAPKLDIPEPRIIIQQIPQPPVYIPTYTPQATNTQPVINIPPSYQPPHNLEELLKKYDTLVRKYLEVKTYKDSIELKDTAGNKVGVVNLNDVVSENSIQKRTPDYQLSFPKTTIITQAPPKVQLYGGGGLLLRQDQLVTGAKAGLYLKNKKDQLYGLSAQKQTGVPITYSVESYWKIRLGRR